MLLIFDFDDTIFDRAANKEYLGKIFEKGGANRHLFLDTYEKTKMATGKAYNFHKHLSLLPEACDKKTILQEFNANYARRTKDFIFPDALKFIKQVHSDTDNKLVLLSFGDEEWQGLKIVSSGVMDFFSRSVITKKPKVAEMERVMEECNVYGVSDKILYFDDIGEEIDRVKISFPYITIFQLKRDEIRFRKHRSMMADHTVKDFDEVKMIL